MSFRKQRENNVNSSVFIRGSNSQL